MVGSSPNCMLPLLDPGTRKSRNPKEKSSKLIRPSPSWSKSVKMTSLSVWGKLWRHCHHGSSLRHCQSNVMFDVIVTSWNCALVNWAQMFYNFDIFYFKYPGSIYKKNIQINFWKRKSITTFTCRSVCEICDNLVVRCEMSGLTWDISNSWQRSLNSSPDM